jgi:hypothetical protein
VWVPDVKKKLNGSKRGGSRYSTKRIKDEKGANTRKYLVSNGGGGSSQLVQGGPVITGSARKAFAEDSGVTVLFERPPREVPVSPIPYILPCTT